MTDMTGTETGLEPSNRSCLCSCSCLPHSSSSFDLEWFMLILLLVVQFLLLCAAAMKKEGRN